MEAAWDEWEREPYVEPRQWPYWLTAIVIGAAAIGGALLWPIEAEGNVMVGPTVKVQNGAAHGSAVHIGNGKYLTAAHVAVMLNDKTEVHFDDGSKQVGVEVMWANTKYDIALIQVDGSELVEARDVACTDPKIGDIVTSEGNPLGFLFVTTYGRVSSAPQPAGHWASVFNMDANVAPGMSGGPVFNEAGDIVGINVGMGVEMPIYLAVPGSVACDLLGRLA